jgi:hypothetical protein
MNFSSVTEGETNEAKWIVEPTSVIERVVLIV